VGRVVGQAVGHEMCSPSPISALRAVGCAIGAGRAPGAVSRRPAPIPINLGPMQLPAGRYYWELKINEETADDWRIAFEWRAPMLAGGNDPSNIPNF
jgi:hypothetical protein